jgi:nucleoside 2-deoxyribosyltransferase
MLPNKRLQVFISSTYKDLIEERQAAVQAVLSAGHIPAGMELFSAGDESQMQVIKKWIDQSDVFLLILGGCYGSIEENSGKSYTQLEYEYALLLGKPTFGIVITEEYLDKRVKEFGRHMIETENGAKLKDFKKLVLSKIVKFFSDSKDIKLSIFETLAEFSLRSDLIGWVPGNQKVDTSKMAEELARLGEENSRLLKEQQKNENLQRKINFKNLSSKRRAFTQNATINGNTIILTTNEYANGQLGEIYIDMPKEGSTLRSLLNYFAAAVSIGLQYGVPLEEFIEKFVRTSFEPSGIVNHPNIKTTTSILDYVFRSLAYEYLNRTDLVNVLDQPEIMNLGVEQWDDTYLPTGVNSNELSEVRVVNNGDDKTES